MENGGGGMHNAQCRMHNGGGGRGGQRDECSVTGGMLKLL